MNVEAYVDDVVVKTRDSSTLINEVARERPTRLGWGEGIKNQRVGPMVGIKERCEGR
jgi:hypothetical protein